jgi:hypothetical protein
MVTNSTNRIKGGLAVHLIRVIANVLFQKIRYLPSRQMSASELTKDRVHNIPYVILQACPVGSLRLMDWIELAQQQGSCCD